MKVLFDIGATNTRVTVSHADGIGEVLRAPTEADPQAEIRLIASLAANALAGAATESVFGCVPGTPRSDGGIMFTPNLPQWDGFAFAAELSRAMNAPVAVEHDASLGALGEAIYGAGQGAENIAYYGIGTGTGVGHIVNGAIDMPIVGFEVGSQIIDATYGTSLTNRISGAAIKKQYGVEPKDAPRSVYDELTAVFASGVYNSILHWQPEVVVLGGSLMNEENGYRLNDVMEALKSFPPFYASFPHIRAAALKGDSNLWGARVLAEKN